MVREEIDRKSCLQNKKVEEPGLPWYRALPTCLAELPNSREQDFLTYKDILGEKLGFRPALRQALRIIAASLRKLRSASSLEFN